MDFVKAEEILKTIQQLDPDHKDTILEALMLAEHIETSSMSFYTKEVEKTMGTELESFFKFMVEEERMHLQKIEELKDMLKHDEVENINWDHHKAPSIGEIKAGKDEMTALLFALWREKKAVDFYEGAAKKSKNSVQKFFAELAEFEKGHVALLEEYVDSLQNTSELIMG